MPAPSPIARRSVLYASLVAAVGALAGCSTPWGDLRVQVGPDASPRARADADARALERARVRSRTLLTWATTAAGRAGSPPALGALAAALTTQLTALGGSSPPTSASSPSNVPSPTSASPPSNVPQRYPADALPAALEAAARAARDDLSRVSDPVARLLACVGAGDATCAAALAAALGVPAPSTSTPTPSTATTTSPATSPATSPTDPGSAPHTPLTPTARPTSASAPSPRSRALALVLSTEEAAVYGYGVLTVRLSGTARDQAVADLRSHTREVDAVRVRLLAEGHHPPAAPPGWALPGPVRDPGSASALALRLETACADAAADLVAGSDPAERATAASLLTDRAGRAAAWRSSIGDTTLDALPGLSGR